MALYGPTGGTLYTGPALGVWQHIPTALLDGTRPHMGHGFFDHFVGSKAMVAATNADLRIDGVTSWIYNEYTAGDLGAGALEGGVITLNGPANGSGCQIQTDVAFVADTDSQLAWGCRYKMVDADAQNVVMGLAVTDADLPGDIAGTTADAIVVRHTADATIFHQVNTGAGGMTAATTGADDVANDTWTTVDCFVDKESKVEWWINGVLKLTYTTTANIPVDTALALSFANEGTASANNYLYLDWAYAYQWHKQV